VPGSDLLSHGGERGPFVQWTNAANASDPHLVCGAGAPLSGFPMQAKKNPAV